MCISLTSFIATSHGMDDSMHKSDMILYCAKDVESHPDFGFNTADLIFIALASSGDYSVSQRISNHITRANLYCPLMPPRMASKAAAPRLHHRSHDHHLDVIFYISPRMATTTHVP